MGMTKISCFVTYKSVSAIRKYILSLCALLIKLRKKMNKISKLKMYVVLACAANFVVYAIYNVYLFSPRIQYSSYSQNRSKATPDQRHQSTPKKHIFFLKTHKTASSTVQNILMRFGLRHSLNFMLPKRNNYLGYTKPIQLSDLASKSIPSDRKFHIFTHHSRYRRHTGQFLYPDTVRVTILRDPAELYESVFDFYKFQKLLKLSFRELLESLPRPAPFAMGARKVQGRNQMSRDLGLRVSQYENATEMSSFIRSIEGDFHLVMIKEHMEASLVLLAGLMGWPLHEVAYIPINRRSNSSKTALSQTDRLKLSLYNRADQLLYEHFLGQFKRRVLEYGLERMVADMRRLHSLNSRLRARCVLRENSGGFARTIGYTLKADADWECVHSAKAELAFTDELRAQQIARLEPVRRLEQLMEAASDRE